jgi:CRP-like cAMP-binding protein
VLAEVSALHLRLSESLMSNTLGALYAAENHSAGASNVRSSDRHASTQNWLLSALSSEERARLLPGMQRVALTLGQVIYEPGSRLEYVYLPTTSVVSSIYTMEEGATAQMALIGNEGVAGLELFLGRDTSHHRTVVQIAGEAIKAAAKSLQAEFARGGLFQHTILQYSDALLMQISQTAACNRLHTVEQRLCRWLLECHDRVNGEEIQMTQENIANMLGVRREGVTVAAGRMQDAGLIQYSRGHINILDRQGLEAIGCECYRAVEQDVGHAQTPLQPRGIMR